MTNPLVELRESRGWTRRRMAQVLGVSYWVLAGVENGLPARPPRAVREGLLRLGLDADEVERLSRAYIAWRDAQAQAVAVE